MKTLENVLIALYTINKEAKQTRNAQLLLKKRLFTEECVRDAIPEVLKQELERYEIDNIMEIVHAPELDYFECSLFIVNDMTPEDNEENARLALDAIEWGDWADAEIRERVYYDIEEDISAEDLPVDLKKEILEIQKTYALQNSVYTEFKEKWDKLHALLPKLAARKRTLYGLKDVVIQTIGINPIQYHKFERSEQIYEYYVIDNFKFHLPINEDMVEESLPIVKINATEISAENNLSAEQKMSFEEAITTLCNYLGVPNETEKILDLDWQYDSDQLYKLLKIEPKQPHFGRYTYEDESDYCDYDDWDGYDDIY